MNPRDRALALLVKVHVLTRCAEYAFVDGLDAEALETLDTMISTLKELEDVTARLKELRAHLLSTLPPPPETLQ